MKNLYLQIPFNEPEISDLVLATLIKSAGSTPQKPGTSALFSRKGLMAGTIGGGILEARIQEKAIGIAGSGRTVISNIHLDSRAEEGEDAWCGGKVMVLIDPDLAIHREIFKKLKESLDQGIPGLLVTVINHVSESEVQIMRYWLSEDDKKGIPDDLYEDIYEEIEKLKKSSDPYAFGLVERPVVKGRKAEQIILLEPINPPPDLVIAGAGHIGKVMAHLGKLLDFNVTVIDDRHEYANKTNLPDADRIVVADIPEALSGIRKTKDTYIVIVTRGHKDDAAALRSCIHEEVAYIGMIGSKNKVALMRSEFLKNGWATSELWERIHTPIGLPINSRTVEEIAISIAAQLIEVRNKKVK